MPQEVQIVPKFQHPHVETYVNDYTQYDDEVSTPVDTNSKFIAVFRSPMGPDNVIIKKNDLADFKKTYGKSDYNKYGQPLMMPIAMLTSGSATVYCMRVMPDDAYAANAILYMLYKTDEETGKMTMKTVIYAPAMLKLVDEILSNSCDEYRRKDNLGLDSVCIKINKDTKKLYFPLLTTELIESTLFTIMLANIISRLSTYTIGVYKNHVFREYPDGRIEKANEQEIEIASKFF